MGTGNIQVYKGTMWLASRKIREEKCNLHRQLNSNYRQQYLNFNNFFSKSSYGNKENVFILQVKTKKKD